MRDLRVKRVYEPPSREDGCRVLVDRIWPRGLSRKRAAVDHWMRALAPSTRLRQWFGHDPQKWPEFRRRYAAELRARHAAVSELRALLKAHARVTLLFGARDERHNNAVALAGYLRSTRRR